MCVKKKMLCKVMYLSFLKNVFVNCPNKNIAKAGLTRERVIKQQVSFSLPGSKHQNQLDKDTQFEFNPVSEIFIKQKYSKIPN